jgi:hypothetical protein
MRTSAGLLFVLCVAPALAQPPEPDPVPLPLPPKSAIPLKAPKDVPQPKPEDAVAIAKLMREQALKNLPTPLVKSNDGWGHQKEFAVGRVMLRNPNRVAPELPRELFNDGLWRRFTVSARDPEKTLAIGFTEMVRPAPDKMNVTVTVALDIDFRMEQQMWVRGRQLYSGETRGHCKTAVQLKAHVVQKTVPKPGSFVPDLMLTITTTEAKLFYDKLVIDHTAGLDGEAAEKVSGLVIDLIKKLMPDLEKQLLDKGGEAIVKAAGTKEIKLELDKLMKSGALKK